VDSYPINDLYEKWKTDPTPDNLVPVVDAMKPAISHALASLNVSNDPYMRTQAKLVAANAIKSYDPSSGAQLPTWVSQQMNRLRRIRRQSQMVMDIPERTMLDAAAIHRAEQEFMDEHDREPDAVELSDKLGMPVKRIQKVKTSFRKTPTAEAVGEESLAGMDADMMNEAMEYVYHEADHIDRKILEHKTGYGGAEVLSPADTARKLKLTPVQLTRRSARLAMKIQDLEDSLRDVNA
jgi:hypothetical protein